MCGLPALEILDISRNKIRTLPKSFGNLVNLKVLSVSKNRIEALPGYIGLMKELRILKIEYNPIVFPPIEITANEAGEEGMDAWLLNLKDYLKDHERAQQVENSDDDTTDDEGRDAEFNTISKTTSSERTGSSVSSSVKSTSSLNNAKNIPKLPPPPIPNKNSHRTGTTHGATRSVSNLKSFQLNPNRSTDMERSRSNSESEDLRPGRRAAAMSRSRNLTTLQEDRARHSRGFSHDSHNYIQENVSETEGPIPTPSEVQQNSRAYFRRLSSLPQSKRISLSSAKVVEAARGLLFSLSQTHQAIRQYVGFCPDPELASKINRMLYNANAHVGTLVDVLEASDTRPEGSEATPVIEACRACVGAFRHVINIVHKRLRDLTSQADMRYTRTLLLLLFGASVEIQNSWNCLKPSEVTSTIAPAAAVSATLPSAPLARQVPPLTRIKSNSNASQSPYMALSSGGLPATEASLAETDEQLFEKISQATTVTLALLSLIGDAVSKSAVATAQGPHTPGAVSTSTSNKLRELAANSVNAGEVSRRLKGRLVTVKHLVEHSDKRKFWEDINAFVKAVINVAALAKSVSSDYPFSKNILASLSTVTRSTKELTILLSVSSFSQAMRSESTSSSPNTQFLTTPVMSSSPAILQGPSSALLTGSSTGTNRFDEDFRPRNDLIRSNSTIKASQQSALLNT